MASFPKLPLAIPLVLLTLPCASPWAAPHPAGTNDAALYPLPSSVDNPILSNSWVIADFDGDGRPDFLTSARAGAGLGQSVSVHFAIAERQPQAFRIPDSRLGLNLIARDVDGDRDLDLVVFAAASNYPLGIWINNGAGGFTKEIGTRIPDSMLSFSGCGVASPLSHSGGSVLNWEDDRPTGGLSAPGLRLHRPACHSEFPARRSANPLLSNASIWHGRAPPASVFSL